MNIDYDHESRQFRGHQRHVQRTAKARLNIDPGFVHYRKIESFIGRHINLVNAMVEKIPSGLPDYQPQLQVDHIYARARRYLHYQRDPASDPGARGGRRRSVPFG